MQTRFIFMNAILSMFIIISGCATDKYSSISRMDADRQAVNRIMDRLHKAVAEGDIETYFTLYAEDAVWISPESRTDVTKETVQHMLQRAIIVYDLRNSDPRTEEVIIDHDLAIVRVSIRGIRPKDVQHVEIFSRHLYILRRQEDASWKISHNMWGSGGGEQFAPPSD